MQGGIVSTRLDRCKRCYSCIRECPAKAIRVVNGQAQIITERCLACGHCIKVCSQDAKFMRNDVHYVLDNILANYKTIAIIAPSFAASFPEHYNKVPTALRSAGFEQVIETAFGADLINRLYRDEFAKQQDKPIIASSCPAVINLIQKYYKDLVPSLAGIVSPMIALGRYLKANLEDEYKIVFIGPCVAKKDEYDDPSVEGVIDAVLTFTELKELFEHKNIVLSKLSNSEFDPPHAGLGRAYPIAGGLLKSADLPDNVLDSEIIVVEGKSKVIDILQGINNNQINAKFIDILFCEGCISGPGVDGDLNYYGRREKVLEFLKENMNKTDKKVWKGNLYNSRNLDLTRTFENRSQRRPMPTEEQIKEILQATGKKTEEQELNCGACGYHTCREHAIAIAKGLGEKEMCLPYLIEEISHAYDNLRLTQEQLHHAEKLASIGQLAAGVAHEINNPLGTIMLYSSILKRQMAKLNEGNYAGQDIDLIMSEANRCKNIVANLLDFARQGKLNLTKFDLIELLETILRKFEKDERAKGVSFNKDFCCNKLIIDGDKEQIEQVISNLIGNAYDAMLESKEKKLTFALNKNDEKVIITVKDTGDGIDEEHKNKIFTPFFTTKQMGKGTGLGLAITYGIIKMHKGDIVFDSEKGVGTTFTVSLPKESPVLNDIAQ